MTADEPLRDLLFDDPVEMCGSCTDRPMKWAGSCWVCESCGSTRGPRERPRGMGSHERTAGATDEWLTPPWLLERLGGFDLDPCSPENRPWDTAKRHMTVRDNGLLTAWEGRVWCNPPYSDVYRWLARCAAHGNAIALVFARTETAGFFSTVWSRADALLFLRGRLTFHTPDGRPGAGNAGAPSVLVAYGQNNYGTLRDLSDLGAFVSTWHLRETVQAELFSDYTEPSGG